MKNTGHSVEVEDVGIRLHLNREKNRTVKDAVFDLVQGKKKETEEFWPLRHIRFDLNKGDRMAIFGLNGSGKSTLLKIIAGVYPPSEGTVQVDGTIAPLLELGAGFCEYYTAVENIYLYSAILGYSHAFIEEREQEIIDFAELWDYTDVPVRNFSSGMRSRLGFAICTTVNPDILILDEVLSVGDAKFQKKSEKRLFDMMDRNTTVLFVSHSIEQAKRLCSKALVLDRGEMAGCGEMEEMAGLYGTIIADNRSAKRSR